MTSVAYISFGKTNIEQLSPTELKILSILHDRLFFNWPGDPLSLLPKQTQDSISSSRKTVKAIQQMWSCVGWNKGEQFSPHGPNDRSRLHYVAGNLESVTLEFLSEYGYGQDDETDADLEMHNIVTTLVSDIEYWQEHFRNSTFIGDEWSDKIVQRLNSASAPAFGHASRTYDLPDLSQVSWEDLIDLRQSPFLKDFRRKYVDFQRRGESDNILAIYEEGLERLSDEVRPSVYGQVTKALLANLPLSPVNPVAVASSIEDISKAKKLKSTYGWLFFFREVRRRRGAAPSSSRTSK